MILPSLLLLAIGLLGAIDIAYFHTYRGRLTVKPESRREAWIHVARGYCYAIQFILVPQLQANGWGMLLFVVLFAIDAAIAVTDVLEEPKSRAAAGGLSGGEYLMHIVLSVLVGAMLCAFFSSSASWWAQPSALTFTTETPFWLRALLTGAAVGSASVSTVELAVLIERALPRPAPIHVRVRVPASVIEVWNITQDHRLHPQWDHRFDRITLALEESLGRHTGPRGTPDPRIERGTTMRYQTFLGPLCIEGFGRYKHHLPLRQSTFEFWSDQRRSLIRRGVGVWRYTAIDSGRTELSTSYTYDVRWGCLGRLIDAFLFRPFFQRFTEASFRRLARDFFGVRHPRVLGRNGRRPERFEAYTPTFAAS